MIKFTPAIMKVSFTYSFLLCLVLLISLSKSSAEISQTYTSPDNQSSISFNDVKDISYPKVSSIINSKEIQKKYEIISSKHIENYYSMFFYSEQIYNLNNNSNRTARRFLASLKI